MRSLIASPPVVTSWLAQWREIGGTVVIISGRALPLRLVSRPDPHAQAAASLQREFAASPWMERGVRVAIFADLQARVLDLLEQPIVSRRLTPANQQAGPAAAAIAPAERKLARSRTISPEGTTK